MNDQSRNSNSIQRSQGSACQTCVERLCGSFSTDRPKAQRFQNLVRGDRLRLDGDSCHQFWTVLDGTAAICSELADGRRQIICVEMPGDTICTMTTAGATENWIEALTPCRICELDLSTMAEDLQHNPEFLSHMFAQAHARLALYTAHLVALGRLDGMERMCLFLCEMAHRQSRGQRENVRVSLSMSREDIADYLGLNTETVSRLFGRVKKTGLAIFLTPTDYVVPKLDTLEQRVPITLPDFRTIAPVASQLAAHPTR